MIASGALHRFNIRSLGLLLLVAAAAAASDAVLRADQSLVPRVFGALGAIACVGTVFAFGGSRWLTRPGSLGAGAFTLLMVLILTGIAAASAVTAVVEHPWTAPPQVLMIPFGWFALLMGLFLIPVGALGARCPEDAPVLVKGAPPPSMAPKAQKPPKPSRQQLLQVPAVGAATTLYKVVDFVVLRALGLVALGYAWLTYQSTRRDPALLEYLDFDSDAAMLTAAKYAAFGALLLAPFVVPRYIMYPTRVIGGAAKCVLLVATLFALGVPLQEVAEAYIPDPYGPVLAGAVPNLLKSIGGITVTGTMALAFFRQLAHAPTDGRAPLPRMPEDDLRRLRALRMDVPVADPAPA